MFLTIVGIIISNELAIVFFRDADNHHFTNAEKYNFRTADTYNFWKVGNAIRPKRWQA